MEQLDGRPERRLGNAVYLADRLRRLEARREEKAAPRRRRRTRRVLTVAAVIAMVAFGATLFRLGAKVAERPAPQFHRVTLRPDAVGSARFTPDGHTIVYCRWGVRPLEVFSVPIP